MDLLAIRIKGIRIKKRLNQEAIAEKIGMTQSNYARLESGKSDIKFERLEQIATAFEMTVGSLIDYDEKADLAEDGRFYHEELQKALKKIDKLEAKIEELKEESNDELEDISKTTVDLINENKELKDKIKAIKIELVLEKEERKKEIYRISEEKERLITEKERLIEEKERTIQIMQKLIDKLG